MGHCDCSGNNNNIDFDFEKSVLESPSRLSRTDVQGRAEEMEKRGDVVLDE